MLTLIESVSGHWAAWNALLDREEFIYRINDSPEGMEAPQHRKHVLNGVRDGGQLEESREVRRTEGMRRLYKIFYHIVSGNTWYIWREVLWLDNLQFVVWTRTPWGMDKSHSEWQTQIIHN